MGDGLTAAVGHQPAFCCLWWDVHTRHPVMGVVAATTLELLGHKRKAKGAGFMTHCQKNKSPSSFCKNYSFSLDKFIGLKSFSQISTLQILTVVPSDGSVASSWLFYVTFGRILWAKFTGWESAMSNFFYCTSAQFKEIHLFFFFSFLICRSPEFQTGR